jgi:SAM-dependent methyltransferase
MTTLTLADLQQIVRTNGALDGWDFSRLRFDRAPVLWDYVGVARSYLKPADRVLDIGTGGGEIFFSLAPYFGEGVAIDHDPAMIAAARRNQSALSIRNVSLMGMEASALQFAAGAFDVVLQRHSSVYVREVVRVLRPGGYFITQMVGKRSSLNILDAFGWTPDSFGPGWWQPVAELADQFRAQGCSILAQAEYDVPCWYQDVESFLFWLMAVPWPEEIDLDKHWQAINRVLEICQTRRGFETNEHRGLLIAQKM